MNNFFKQTGKSARDMAKGVAQKMRQEPAEILKDAKTQITGAEQKNESQISVMQQVMTGDGKVKDLSPIKEQEIAAQTKSRLQEIEAELRRLRMQREQTSQEWAKEQNRLLGTGGEERQTQQGPQQVEMPSQGHKKGPRSAHQSKKGSMEVGRQHKG